MFKKKRIYLNSYFKPITSMKTNQIINEAVPDTPSVINRMSDEEGLNRAYNSPNSIYVDGNKMYIEMFLIGS